ncbi:glycogen/starch/alpha-glucan phosphorylase [Nodosilinea sp. LEGE 07298]|uniref:glycogen/starch/alpha-glucan phosphorylase n=1 Tax=Nodosilinea sp. LEGE 07298 TaxID=2777970 RepID=UPI00187F6836|nr:glycogen/starch/alpha-glucan phosphorylase [Nodosilinea sp. LEGE 07298]MBE9108379.1 glycogen/starch/alpha-glucan phosphorylase [Nodosilinea sp. LEGE 07298]
MAKQSVRLPDSSTAAEVPLSLGVAGDVILDAEAQVSQIQQALVNNLHWVQGKDEQFANAHDYYTALAHSVRNQLLQKRIRTAKTYADKRAKTVYYLSAEFLMGRQLGNGLINLGLYDTMRHALADCGLDLDELLEREAEPGLGNGGLGRLAACFMDSLTTLNLPAVGYGIRYEFGIFTQLIRQGHQVEAPDKWLSYGNPWEIARPDYRVEIKFGGHTEVYRDGDDDYQVRWVPGQTVIGIPHDVPVPGYGTENVNILRLWKAEAGEAFDLVAFNSGDYFGAVASKMISENITKVLYPNDETRQGKELRLQQQYFFVACSLQDIIRLHLRDHSDLTKLADSAAIQLNDTHPAIGVAELMRLLLDEHHMEWETAWQITQRAFGYTNHTLMPEALERWSVDLFGKLLPRHLELIYEINQRFLDQVKLRYPKDPARLERLSLIEEGPERRVRMANLACVGSHAINGVAALHTELLKQEVLQDFYELWPHKFSNKTNGITPRRWLLQCNPRLAQLISETIGDSWITNLDLLKDLEAHVDNADFRRAWQAIKQENKWSLARYIQDTLGLEVNPDSMFDVQIKRIHEYKRQLMNVLHVVTLYNRMVQNPGDHVVPRTVIFGGKAAPGYAMAKLVVKLINAVADVVNNDPIVAGRLKVVFLPNYNVSQAQRLFPASDLSEQISTAGMEASGTGNMKFALNGALTVGTLDGANVEIREEVGADNFFLFGLTTEQVAACKAVGHNPWYYYDTNPELKRVLDVIASGLFSPGEPDLFLPILDSLLVDDPYMVMADYAAYVQCQEHVSRTYEDRDRWVRMAILNTARIGKFSADRTIAEYARDIWKVKAVPVAGE